MEYIGYAKYHGEDIVDGIFDAKQSAQALLGFDEIIRYFLIKEDPMFRNFDFSLPVKIEEGSWGIFAPENIEQFITISQYIGVATGAGVGGSLVYKTLKTYLEESAKIAAKDGLFEVGAAKDFKKIIRAVLKYSFYIPRIASHVGGFIRNFKNGQVKLLNNDEVCIINNNGKKLVVPLQVLEIYKSCPENLYSKITSVVTERHELEIGYNENGKIRSTRITHKEKSIFYKEEENDEIVLPDLIDGEYVELKGTIVRCNETYNNLGFRYAEHTIMGKPESGHIVDFKSRIISHQDNHIYPPVLICGVIERKDIQGGFKEKYPVIRFTDITPLEDDKPITPDLFG